MSGYSDTGDNTPCRYAPRCIPCCPPAGQCRPNARRIVQESIWDQRDSQPNSRWDRGRSRWDLIDLPPIEIPCCGCNSERFCRANCLCVIKSFPFNTITCRKCFGLEDKRDPTVETLIQSKLTLQREAVVRDRLIDELEDRLWSLSQRKCRPDIRSFYMK